MPRKRPGDEEVKTGEVIDLPPSNHEYTALGARLARGHSLGGTRPGAGRKSSEVKKLEHDLLNSLYPNPWKKGGPEIELGSFAICRLIQIAAQSTDLPSAVAASRVLLNRKFGREKIVADIQVTGDHVLSLIDASAVARVTVLAKRAKEEAAT